MKKIIKKLINRETISYIIIGTLTTAISFLIYYICFNKFNIKASIANIIANIISIAFAYITNSRIVFQEKYESVKKELHNILKFVMSRFFTFLLEEFGIILTVDVLNFDGNLMKIFFCLIVIILNYLLSKILVFKK